MKSTLSQSGAEPLLTSVDGFIKKAVKDKLYNGDSLDLLGLIQTIDDIQVEFVPMDSSISGALQRENDKWKIIINKVHHPNRQKFTLAHELGHYVLHKNENENFTDTVFFRGVSNDNIEQAANRFASSLLMPENRVKDLINNHNIKNIGELAKCFGVSAAAMLNRVKELGFKLKLNG